MPAPVMSFDERYRAVASRDSRFDGQFVLAVRTTKIYCRPSCPARTPKSSNVTFYATSAAAHEAGFRACKRCLPEAAPGSPEWDVRGDAAARVMRLIADGVVEREGVEGLAARVGYSSRHLTRLMRAEVGAGTLSLARAQRAHNARLLLIGTDMSVSDVAFSAGFHSIRQCNDTVLAVFGMTPTQLRAHRRAATHPAPGELQLLLPYRAPLDVAGIFRWMQDRALEGMEKSTAESFARHLRMPGGPAWFEVRAGDSGRLQLSARVTQLSDLMPLVSAVRRLFDLDADPEAIDDALSSHPELRARTAEIAGIRVPGTADPHEMVIRAMVGQQITVTAARTALTSLVAQLGERVETGVLFPTMSAIAEHGREVLRGPAARVTAIVETAAALADGSLSVGIGEDSTRLREALLARKGIGPWTADYVRMRVVGDPDVLLPGDVVVRAGAASLGIPAAPRDLTEWAARTSPWRSYLTAHLWRAAPTKPRSKTQETS